ncbi:Sialate O-acetylesterase [Nymphon striatum]|nr:Sialate O-acetylesterase [Nymphon striatum]
MIQLLNHKDYEVTRKIRAIFQVSYAVEADILKAIEFPPLKRNLSEFLKCETDFYSFSMEGLMAAVIEIKNNIEAIHIQSLVVDPYFFRQESENIELSLNPLFSDHMVLQQKEYVTVWGAANPMEKISVSGSWGEEITSTANASGKWQLKLPTPKAGGPFQVIIAAENHTITLKDVLIGEVWLASGQSNMEMPLEGFLPKEPVDNYKEEVSNANYDQIRYFNVTRAIEASPVDTPIGQWNVTNSENANKFSAAGYFFARRLHKELGVPVGVITSTWGGTPVESWMSKEKIKSLAEFPEEYTCYTSKIGTTIDLEDAVFSSPDFDDSKWTTAETAAIVEDLPIVLADGVYWFRKSIMINDISSNYTINIADGIDDMDDFFKKQIFQKIGNSDKLPGIKGSKLLLFNKNQEALENPPAGIESYSLNSHTPTVLYNGMINPIIPYNIKGAIWYQGESNVGRAEQYLKLFPGMIEDWRERWNSDFPFYFVQIAPFTYGNELSPALRDAQRKSLKTPKTGMAIVMDIGLPKSIHPGNKQDVGHRLAQLALANDYNKNIVASGPLYKGHTIAGSKISIDFDHVGSGLRLKSTEISAFEIAGIDKKFVPAKAIITGDAVNGNSVELSAKGISEPKYARYAWKDYIVGTLFNQEDLPASSFTT